MSAGRSLLARRQQRWLRASADTTQRLLSGAEPQEVLALVTEQALEISGADLVVPALPAGNLPQLVIEHAAGKGAGEALGIVLAVSGSVSGLVLGSGKPLSLANFRNDNRVAPAAREHLLLGPWPGVQGRRQGGCKAGGQAGGTRQKGQVMKVLNFTARGRSRGRRRDSLPLPGSRGEHSLQQRYGTGERASRFYENQFSSQLTPEMMEFIGRMEMAFIATSDAAGECDCSFRAGTTGFLRVLDDHTIAYPEFRGNGVMASLGNLLENPHIGIFMADFTHDLIGLHVNGDAEIVTPAHMQELDRCLPEQATHPGRRPVQWVLVRVTEAYIHCSKHIPKLIPQSRVRHWGTDNPRHKGGDYFGTAARRTGGLEAGPRPAPAAAASNVGQAG